MAALLATLALFTPSSTTCHPNLTWSVRAQLDADPAGESLRPPMRTTAVTRPSTPSCTSGTAAREAGAHTPCSTSMPDSWRSASSTSTHGHTARKCLSRPRPAGSWSGSSTTVGPVRVPVQLFAYEPSPTPEGFLPGPAASVALGDFDSNSRGLEVKVTETFTPIEPGPALESVTVFLYDRRERKYVATPTIRSPHERQAPQRTTVTTTPLLSPSQRCLGEHRRAADACRRTDRDAPAVIPILILAAVPVAIASPRAH